jgi:hypothetical protein
MDAATDDLALCSDAPMTRRLPPSMIGVESSTACRVET